MTVLVTGASGHVGGNLVRALLARGLRVRVLLRQDARAVEGLDVERFQGDVLDPSALPDAFRGAEVVYHLAARISITGDPAGEVRAVNVDGVRNVVEACLSAGVRRLVHMSSIHAFVQTPVDEPLDETRPPAEGDGFLAYDRSKSAGQREVLAAVERGLDAVVVNPTAVLGPYDFKPSAMGQVLLDLQHRRLPALVGGGFDWVDVRDVCEATIAAASVGRRGECYLLSGEWRTVREVAETAERITGVRAPRWTAPVWLARASAPAAELLARATGRRALFTRESLRVLREANRRVSHAKASREIDYRPRRLAETVEDAYRWFRDAGMLRPTS
ncbi:MAG: SDR family oxidoreductase [Myxococcota bacterium]|nr:SDR family oxidoreductase [Myxococcota bacterium]